MSQLALCVSIFLACCGKFVSTQFADNYGAVFPSQGVVTHDHECEVPAHSALSTLNAQLAVNPQSDVYFERVKLDVVPIGQSVVITVISENRGSQTRHVVVQMRANVKEITGQLISPVRFMATGHNITDFVQRKNIELFPGQREIVTMAMAPEMYVNHLTNTAYMEIYAWTFVNETQQIWSDEARVSIIKPNITLQMPNRLTRGSRFTLVLKFTNPIGRDLTNGYFSLHSNFLRGKVQYKFKDVKPYENVVSVIQLTPEFPNYETNCFIIANFNAPRMIQFQGEKSVPCS